MIFRETQMQPKGHSKLANEPSGDVERLLVRKEGQGTRFTGTEPIFGGFTNSSTIISNIRLTHNGQIFVSIAEIGAALVTLSREYRFHGDAVRAYHEIVRIRSNFDSRVQQWKTEELNRLQSKKSMNGNQIRDLEKEINRVRQEVSRGESTLNRLQNDLDLISRVGDDCPLLRPQESESSFADDEYQVPEIKKKKKIDKALLSLAKLVQPHGLSLKFDDARFRDDFDDAIREHVYDQRTHLSLIVHWSDRHPQTRERGNIYLRILLIPKSVEALETLPGVVENHEFEVKVGEDKGQVDFANMSIADEKTIVEKKLKDYLYDIEANAFQHKDLIIKRPFSFFAGDFTPRIRFEQGTKLEFLLRVAKKVNLGPRN